MINNIVNLTKEKGAEINKIQDDDGVKITEPTKIANHFNHFFVNIGQKLSNSFTKSDSTSPRFHSQQDSFYLKPITVQEVESHIKQLNPSKSVRPSDPQIKFIKLGNKIIAPSLTLIFNICIQKATSSILYLEYFFAFISLYLFQVLLQATSCSLLKSIISNLLLTS